VRLINDPVKVAYVDGELLLEVHPPVDAQGQTVEPVLADFEQLLDHALGTNVAAIHWDYALETLQAARGIPVTVGLEADPNAVASQPANDAASASDSPPAAADAPPTEPAATSTAAPAPSSEDPKITAASRGMP